MFYLEIFSGKQVKILMSYYIDKQGTSISICISPYLSIIVVRSI